MGNDTTTLTLALATEDVELRAAAFEVQELLIETAINGRQMYLSLICSSRAVFI